MQDIWYGDARDMLKWSVLVMLAQRHRLKTIVQVAFFHPADRPTFEASDYGVLPIEDTIWNHFRDICQVRRLERQHRVAIHVLDCAFAQNDRQSYVRRIVASLRACRGPKVVLLDPDTGIAPRIETRKHVRLDEITTIWSALRPRDWLVLYQHSSREQGWCAKKRQQFAEACDCPVRTVHTFASRQIARDAVFFATARP